MCWAGCAQPLLRPARRKGHLVMIHARWSGARFNDMQRAHLCMLSAGFGLGAAAGLLFAPKAGKKTRTQIAKAVIAATNSAKKHGQAIGHSAVAVVKHGKVPI